MDSSDAPNVAIGVIAIIIVLAIYFVPILMIIRKAGYSGWWILILFVPLVNIIMLWVFAFASWPSLRDHPAAAAPPPMR
jgi:uncharacterized membrane protein YhaH (DUF805 family)